MNPSPFDFLFDGFVPNLYNCFVQPIGANLSCREEPCDCLNYRLCFTEPFDLVPFQQQIEQEHQANWIERDMQINTVFLFYFTPD